MTRIDCIPTDHIPRHKRLVAAYREMLRVRHLYPRKSKPSVPTYRTGEGHVLFFADKGAWLLKRHAELRERMRQYDFEVNFELDLSHWPPEAMGDWEPSIGDKLVSIARIINRVMNGDRDKRVDKYRKQLSKQV